MNHEYYVLHVKEGFEERKKSILAQFLRLQIPVQWILAHDISEISQTDLQKYNYQGSLRNQEISCCLKHIAAWEKIAAGPHAGGFVFEDDVLIDLQRFTPVVNEAIAEFQATFPDRLGCICLGDGCALYVPWTRKKKGTRLYAAEYVRAADSYWLSRETAQLMLDWLRQHGFDRPADHVIDEICAQTGIPILWMEPPVVSQGSHTGRFQSSIQLQESSNKTGKKIEWFFKRIRRKYLFPLLGIDLTRR
ncbi:MAG: hypothetical protein A2505_06570 [Deltaproteobacteria bacterium RIFOXYD12_FULL_55_16]|nr:MAG: hypothetical protein A2505_06570 [Deltaproteobacteria bacterium RIFOXYD12_FULL_55_16]